MALGAASYGLGLAAGVLSTLSPCVLPLLPLILASAVSAHRRGPWALALGLALCYAVIGSALAASGNLLGVSARHLHLLGALALLAFGLVLMVPPLQLRFMALASSLGGAGAQAISSYRAEGWRGQLVLGLLLGLVWSPCAGPTLGSAIALASQGSGLGQVALLMGLFGLGAALPLLILGQAGQAVARRWRGRLHAWAGWGKGLLGLMMVGLALVALSGLDRYLEAWMTEHSPAWLTRLSTSF